LSLPGFSGSPSSPSADPLIFLFLFK
jgi:hypothetical protein